MNISSAYGPQGPSNSLLSALRLYIVTAFLFIAVSTSYCQDIHFSQFFMSPMGLNPAMAGDFDAEYRFAANYRDQWRSVTDNPFTTLSLSAESNGEIGPQTLGTGLYIMSDKAGDGQLRTLVVNVGAAYSLPMNTDSSSTLRLGAQLGYTQKRIDYSRLRFDRQYNGQVYDPGLLPNEDFSNDKIVHPNVNLGLLFSRNGEDRKRTEIGLSLFNMTTPNEAFNSDADVPLDLRLVSHAEVTLPITDQWDVMPSGQFMSQGVYQEVLLGSRFRHTWRDDAIGLSRGWIGGFARLSDGMFVTAGVDYDSWRFGLSYDINLSPLDVASSSRGGFELSAIYLLDLFREQRKRHRACPAWL